MGCTPRKRSDQSREAAALRWMQNSLLGQTSKEEEEMKEQEISLQQARSLTESDKRYVQRCFDAFLRARGYEAPDPDELMQWFHSITHEQRVAIELGRGEVQ
jgi:hypothetical protein